MSRYHIMRTYFEDVYKNNGNERVIQIMDFKEARIIRLTMDEVEKDEISDSLKEFVKANRHLIEEGRWDVRKV